MRIDLNITFFYTRTDPIEYNFFGEWHDLFHLREPAWLQLQSNDFCYCMPFSCCSFFLPFPIIFVVFIHQRNLTCLLEFGNVWPIGLWKWKEMMRQGILQASSLNNLSCPLVLFCLREMQFFQALVVVSEPNFPFNGWKILFFSGKRAL